MKLFIIQKDIKESGYLAILEDLRDSEADIVAFGELAVSGCLYDGAEPEDYPTVEALSEQLGSFPFAVMLGFPRWEKGRMFNSYLYTQNGKYQTYDKINLFEPMNETTYYQAGKNPTVFDTEFGKLGVSICFDVRFPELYDRLKEKGAEYIFIPAAFPRARIGAWRSLLVERAKQTGLTVIGINSVGDDGTNEFGGSSMVINGEGKIIAQLDEINESIIEVEL